MRDFRALKVWEKAHALTLEIYSVTSVFPQSEMFGLTSQMRRSSASIPANIAEGWGSDGDGEFARVLQVSMGWASELEYHLLLARDLGYLSEERYARVAEQVVEVRRMLAVLIRTVRPRS